MPVLGYMDALIPAGITPTSLKLTKLTYCILTKNSVYYYESSLQSNELP